jgi:hypothetical protein
MSEIYTYEYVRKLLDNINANNKLKWNDFLLIFKYVDLKFNNIKLLRKKRLLVLLDVSIIKDVISKLERIINSNLVESDIAKKQIKNIVEEWNNKLKSV